MIARLRIIVYLGTILLILIISSAYNHVDSNFFDKTSTPIIDESTIEITTNNADQLVLLETIDIYSMINIQDAEYKVINDIQWKNSMLAIWAWQSIISLNYPNVDAYLTNYPAILTGPLAQSKVTGILAIGEFNGHIQIWDSNLDVQLQTISAENVVKFNDIDFSPDENLLMASDDLVYVWSTDDWKMTTIKTINPEVDSIAYYQPDKLLAATGSYGVQVFNVEDIENPVVVYESRVFNPLEIEFSPTGEWLVGGELNELHFLHIPTHQLTTIEVADADGIFDLEFNNNGTLLIFTGGTTGNIHIWNVMKKQSIIILEHIENAFVHSIEIGFNGNYIASADYENVYIWSISTH